jgi:hypothetical protein
LNLDWALVTKAKAKVNHDSLLPPIPWGTKAILKCKEYSLNGASPPSSPVRSVMGVPTPYARDIAVCPAEVARSLSSGL